MDELDSGSYADVDSMRESNGSVFESESSREQSPPPPYSVEEELRREIQSLKKSKNDEVEKLKASLKSITDKTKIIVYISTLLIVFVAYGCMFFINNHQTSSGNSEPKHLSIDSSELDNLKQWVTQTSKSINTKFTRKWNSNRSIENG